MDLKDKDPLSPASKDPAEGARDTTEETSPDGDLEQSHLGAGGDPAEGRDGTVSSPP
jgi:hypothetical protein